MLQILNWQICWLYLVLSHYFALILVLVLQWFILTLLFEQLGVRHVTWIVCVLGSIIGVSIPCLLCLLCIVTSTLSLSLELMDLQRLWNSQYRTFILGFTYHLVHLLELLLFWICKVRQVTSPNQPRLVASLHLIAMLHIVQLFLLLKVGICSLSGSTLWHQLALIASTLKLHLDLAVNLGLHKDLAILVLLQLLLLHQILGLQLLTLLLHHVYLHLLTWYLPLHGESRLHMLLLLLLVHGMLQLSLLSLSNLLRVEGCLRFPELLLLCLFLG